MFDVYTMETPLNDWPEEYLEHFFNEATDNHPEQEIEEEQPVVDEVEQARDFLLKAGLSDLSKIYQEGNEITDVIVNNSVREKYLTEKQAQTVRSRVRTLNKTLGNRKPRRKQRQDIRDVAWNVETSSTGSRSRSATPDSLDSVGALNEELTSDEDQSLPHLSLDTNQAGKGKLKWTSSEPLQNKVFQRLGRENVAHLDSNNVVLKGYYRLEENRSVKPRRERSGSDPTPEVLLKQFQTDSEGYLSSSPNCNTASAPSDPGLSFDEMLRSRQEEEGAWDIATCNDFVCIDSILDSEYQHLKPLLWVEVTSIFDTYKVYAVKKKQSKRKRGNVFNVNLSTLVMRDLPNPSENSMVPQIFQLVISELVKRCLREDGIMRVGCHKQKLDMLCKDIEDHFYSDRQHIELVISEAHPHCLTGVLKKLLRDLPDPIFTMELFDMFYKTTEITVVEDQVRALNLLTLLLPVEHRNTFRYLIDFFLKIVANEQYNRMSLKNVAMIVAPSFFVPRVLSPRPTLPRISEKSIKDQLVEQLRTAATCCAIMEVILKNGERLWMIPRELVIQAREAQKKAQIRKTDAAKEKKSVGKKKLQRSNTQYEPGAMLSPKITRDYVY